jgi:hypothetical protein
MVCAAGVLGDCPLPACRAAAARRRASSARNSAALAASCRLSPLLRVGMAGPRSAGSHATARMPISARTRVPASRSTPQRRESASTRFRPKPPPFCRSGARRAIDPPLPRSSTSRRMASPRTSARTLKASSAGVSAWRTRWRRGRPQAAARRRASSRRRGPAIRAATAARAAAGASSAAASVTSKGPKGRPGAGRTAERPARAAVARCAAVACATSLDPLHGPARAAREDLHRCAEDRRPSFPASATHTDRAATERLNAP